MKTFVILKRNFCLAFKSWHFTLCISICSFCHVWPIMLFAVRCLLFALTAAATAAAAAAAAAVTDEPSWNYVQLTDWATKWPPEKLAHLNKHCQRHNGPREQGIDYVFWVLSKVEMKTSWRDCSRYRVNTLGPLCLCFNFGHQVALHKLVASMATRWHYLH